MCAVGRVLGQYAMPCGGTLTICTANADLDETFCLQHHGAVPGRYVSLSVIDTGCGMSAETLTHAFEPFFTTKGPGKGTGLGLATVYGIVKQSGGLIAITSASGLGTTITMYLPAVDDALAVATERSAALIQTGGETILLVEDDTAVRSLMTRTLRTFGYTILEASDGREALNVAKNHPLPIQLLVSDVVMPEMNGPHLAQQLLGERPELKVLFVSGFPQTALAGGTVNRHVGFLSKPFTAATLASAVDTCLRGTVSVHDVAIGS
jgi:CheY-like chemotaxis protein